MLQFGYLYLNSSYTICMLQINLPHQTFSVSQLEWKPLVFLIFHLKTSWVSLQTCRGQFTDALYSVHIPLIYYQSSILFCKLSNKSEISLSSTTEYWTTHFHIIQKFPMNINLHLLTLCVDPEFCTCAQIPYCYQCLKWKVSSHSCDQRNPPKQLYAKFQNTRPSEEHMNSQYFMFISTLFISTELKWKGRIPEVIPI